MRYMKKLTAAIISVSLCVTNLVAFAEVSDKQTIQDYFETKGSDDRETTEIIVSFSGDIKSDNIDSIDSIIQDGLKISSDKEMEIGNVSKPVEPITKIDTSLEKVLDKNTVLIKTNDVETTLQALKSNENVVYAQPNYRLYTASEDAINSKLWAMENKGQIINGTQGNEKADLNIQAAWDITKGSEDVVVAVLDTGIDITHPALAENIWVNTDEQSNGSDSDGNGYNDDINGWDFVNNDASVFDKAEIDEHGTHMAGIIAANGQNGVYGVAPNVKIMPLKVMENDSGYTSDIIEAIRYAEANGAKIVNCSFAGLDYNPALEDAISKSDMLFVTAAGNFAASTDNLVAFPACYDCKNIISVGASDNTGSIAALSSYGDLVNVYAPGTGIYSTLPDEQYDFKNGTSCSAAHVSGIAALLYSEYPELTVDQAKEAICTKTYDNDEIQLSGETKIQLDAKSVLEFDFSNAKSSVPKIIDNSINTGEREESYPFSFYDNSGVRFSLNADGVKNGTLTISKIGENKNAETVFYTAVSDGSRNITVTNIKNDTEYNFMITYTQGTTVHNYYGKLKKSYIEDENKYLTETYNIVTNNYVQTSALDSANDGISLLSNESESNNVMSNADEISDDEDVYGTISSASDVDWYKVQFSSSGVANFWLGQVPSGCNYQLELYNASGTYLTGSYNGNGQQELISFYTVSANTLYYIKIYSASGYSSSQYKFRTKWYPSPDRYEDNDTFSTATFLPNNSYKSANINHPNDVDFYKFTVSGKSYVEVSLNNIPSGCRYNMEIYKSAGESGFISGVYSSGRSKQWQSILTSGTYYIRVYSYQNSSYAAQNYRISLDVGIVRSISIPGSFTENLVSSEIAAYTFSISAQCGVKIDLAGVSSSDFDLILYKISENVLTEEAAGDDGSKTGETVSATLSSGDYILIVKRYSGSETSFNLTSSKTTTAKAAEITLSGFPSVMTIGSTESITVTVKNTGMNVWTKSDGYKLGCMNDAPSFMSSELTLNSSDKIQYGQSKTFTVNITAPSVSFATDYTLSFRMKHNSTLFGSVSESKKIRVMPEFENISVGNTKTVSGVSEKYYKLNVTSAANYVFRTMKYNSSCDTELYLYNSSMKQIEFNDDAYSGSGYSKIEAELSTGTYYICVKPHFGNNVQCYLNVNTYSDKIITTSVNISNEYEGYYKYIVSSAGTYVFSTKKYSRDCDTYLIILDSNGNLIAENNDSSSIYAKIETNLSKGTYYIRVSSYRYIAKGENVKTYCTLTVGSKNTAPTESDGASVTISSPSSSGVIKTYSGNSVKISGSVSNCSGVTVKVGNETLSNVKLNGSKYEAYYIPTESGTYTITVIGNAIWGSNPSAVKTVTIAVNDDSDNFNSSPTALNSGTERIAAIDYAGDVDCFSFTPQETGSYKIYSSGSVDLKGILYENDKKTAIGTSYNAPESINFKLARTLEKNKTYYIRVDAEINGATGRYSINIEKIDEPDDEYFGDQWALCNKGSISTANGDISTRVGYDINVLPVWEYTKGKDILVGVIDTGVDYEHDDLTDNLKLPGIDTVHNTTDVFPTNEKTLYDIYGNERLTTAVCGHGTHVSGIISAVGNNNKGISGVAPNAKILPIKALGNPLIGEDSEENLSTSDNLLTGIKFAINNNAKIVNMSIGGYDSINSIEETINSASNILFVVSAGNSSKDLSVDDTKYEYPAMYNCDNMIIVAAMNYNGNLCNFSNYGGPTQIAAPGDVILSTFATTKTYYRFSGGTSMAAPHVSGVAALIWSYYKDLTAAQVKQRIISPNNVSYSNKLDGKVSSNGCLNAWYAFSNDSASPRKIPKRESLLNEIQKRKERIAEIKSKKPDNEKTTGIFVKSLNDNCINILNECLTSYKYEIVKQYDMTGIYLLEFDSIEHADEAINLLNARSDIKFAEPNYVLTLGGDY